MNNDFSFNGQRYVIPQYLMIYINEIKKVIFEEENRVLNFAHNIDFRREDILIMFVRMYIFRYALPYIEILHKNANMDKENIKHQLQKKLWLCMYGRALDDIWDSDSNFFSKKESILLMNEYYQLVFNEEIQQYIKDSLIESTNFKYSENIIIESKKNLLERVKYLFDNDNSIIDQKYKSYVSTILLYSDFIDILSDIHTSQETVLSDFIKFNYVNDENKLILSNSLLSEIKLVKKQIIKEFEYIIKNNFSCHQYITDILLDTMNKLLKN